MQNNRHKSAEMIFMVCLRVCIVGLLLLGAAQAQRFTTPEDTVRADALLKQMTIQEKIGQLNQPFYAKLPIPGVKIDPVPYEERVRRSEVGSFLFLND
jgi:beta-glucosidase